MVTGVLPVIVAPLSTNSFTSRVGPPLADADAGPSSTTQPFAVACASVNAMSFSLSVHAGDTCRQLGRFCVGQALRHREGVHLGQRERRRDEVLPDGRGHVSLS